MNDFAIGDIPKLVIGGFNTPDVPTSRHKAAQWRPCAALSRLHVQQG